MPIEFADAIRKHQNAFELNLSDEKISALADYYELIKKRNPLLHLVAPCSPEEFAIRHILESLSLLKFLPEEVRFADVGAGAGLPSIPCLIVREDLKAVLIESKIKKANFLAEASSICALSNRAEVINKQFGETPKPDVQIVVCRALDKFPQNLKKLLRWSEGSVCVLFAGEEIGASLQRLNRKFQKTRIPMSEKRFVFLTSGD